MTRIVDKDPGKEYQPLYCRCGHGFVSGKTLDSIRCNYCGKVYAYYKLGLDIIYRTPKGELVPLKKGGGAVR